MKHRRDVFQSEAALHSKKKRTDTDDEYKPVAAPGQDSARKVPTSRTRAFKDKKCTSPVTPVRVQRTYSAAYPITKRSPLDVPPGVATPTTPKCTPASSTCTANSTTFEKPTSSSSKSSAPAGNKVKAAGASTCDASRPKRKYNRRKPVAPKTGKTTDEQFRQECLLDLSSEDNLPGLEMYHNFLRLKQLFPRMTPMAIQNLLVKCEGELPKAIDNILYLRNKVLPKHFPPLPGSSQKRVEMHQSQVLQPIPQNSQTLQKQQTQLQQHLDVKEIANQFYPQPNTSHVQRQCSTPQSNTNQMQQQCNMQMNSNQMQQQNNIPMNADQMQPQYNMQINADQLQQQYNIHTSADQMQQHYNTQMNTSQLQQQHNTQSNANQLYQQHNTQPNTNQLYQQYNSQTNGNQLRQQFSGQLNANQLYQQYSPRLNALQQMHPMQLEQEQNVKNAQYNMAAAFRRCSSTIDTIGHMSGCQTNVRAANSSDDGSPKDSMLLMRAPPPPPPPLPPPPPMSETVPSRMVSPEMMSPGMMSQGMNFSAIVRPGMVSSALMAPEMALPAMISAAMVSPGISARPMPSITNALLKISSQNMAAASQGSFCQNNEHYSTNAVPAQFKLDQFAKPTYVSPGPGYNQEDVGQTTSDEVFAARQRVRRPWDMATQMPLLDVNGSCDLRGIPPIPQMVDIDKVHCIRSGMARKRKLAAAMAGKSFGANAGAILDSEMHRIDALLADSQIRKARLSYPSGRGDQGDLTKDIQLDMFDLDQFAKNSPMDDFRTIHNTNRSTACFPSSLDIDPDDPFPVLVVDEMEDEIVVGGSRVELED